jgi:hypothetical protein
MKSKGKELITLYAKSANTSFWIHRSAQNVTQFSARAAFKNARETSAQRNVMDIEQQNGNK